MEVTPKVTLLRYTQDPEQAIALAAKLCYSDSDIAGLNENLQQKNIEKFIEKLVSMNHFSPIEHASFTFGIEGVSRSLLAQITRHRIASFSVKSQRYVDSKEFNYIIPPAIKQLGADAVEEYKSQMETMASWYAKWQQKLGGVQESSNEDARFVLPNASETKMIVTMNARELYHFFALRCCNRAQWEIREVAWQMLKLAQSAAPSLFRKAGPACAFGACSEGAMCCGKTAEIRQRRAEL